MRPPPRSQENQSSSKGKDACWTNKQPGVFPGSFQCWGQLTLSSIHRLAHPMVTAYIVLVSNCFNVIPGRREARLCRGLCGQTKLFRALEIPTLRSLLCHLSGGDSVFPICEMGLQYLALRTTVRMRSCELPGDRDALCFYP